MQGHNEQESRPLVLEPALDSLDERPADAAAMAGGIDAQPVDLGARRAVAFEE
jgi:hypothetical protein